MPSTNDDARFWNGIARKYATDPIKDMAGYERTLARVATYLRASDRALEIGCGTGATALRLAPHVAQLDATDVSPEMIAIARERAADASAGNVNFAIAASSSADGGPYDVVLAFNLLHLVRDRAATLAHVRALLKPDGLFISKTPCLSEMNVMIRLAVPVMRRIGKAPHVDFFTAAGLESEIAASGFSILERDRHGSARKDPRIFLVARVS